jgi:hypothetical protein
VEQLKWSYISHKGVKWLKNILERVGEVAQVVECLPNKLEALTSNPITTKKKKKFWETVW